MKKGLILMLQIFAASWFISCEKEVFDINPTMEAYYMESIKLPSATIDSVKSFSSKVDGFTKSYPLALEHEKYPKIKEIIKAASLRLTIDVDTTWDVEKTIWF